LIHSICFAASESAKNLIGASPLVGGVVGFFLPDLMGASGDSGVGYCIIGGLTGFIGLPIIAKNTLKHTEGIHSGYVILGATATTALTAYLLMQMDNHSILKEKFGILLLVAAAYAGGRIGSNQTAIYVPLANFRF
jgi:hypothetical protein